MSLQPIYLSYRRTLSAQVAAALYRELTALGFGVYADKSPEDATWLEDEHRHELQVRPHVIFLLQAGSLRRCSDPSGDVLLKEIELAAEWDKNRVIVGVQGLDLKAEVGYLPAQLRTELLRQPQVYVTPQNFAEIIRQAAGQYCGPQSLAPKAHGASTPAQVPYFQKGLALLGQLDPKQLLIQFTSDVEASPQNVEAYFFRGLVQAAQKQFKRAVEDYSKAVMLAPDFSAGYAKRASAYAALGQHDLAIADYRHAIGLRHVPADYVGLGRLYEQLGRMEEALAIALAGVGRYGQQTDSADLYDLTLLYQGLKKGHTTRPVPASEAGEDRPSSRLSRWLGGGG